MRESQLPRWGGLEGLLTEGGIGTGSRRVVFLSGKDILRGFPQISPQENKITTQNYF